MSETDRTPPGAVSWAWRHAKAFPHHRTQETLDDPGSCLTCGDLSPAHGLRGRRRRATNEPSADDRESMDTTHDVKCWPAYFDAICEGRKTYEIRINDRDYREGDAILIREYDPGSDTFSGRLILAQIGYVLPLDSRGARGHVAFSLIGCVKPAA